MISSKKGNTIFMHDFQYENVQKRLHTIESSINIVAHKKIVCCLEINHKSTGGFPEI